MGLLSLLPVHPDEFVQQLILGFHVGGIPEDAVHKQQMQALLPVHPDEFVQ